MGTRADSSRMVRFFDRLLADGRVPAAIHDDLATFWNDHGRTLRDLGLEQFAVVLSKLKSGNRRGAAEELLRDLGWEEAVALWKGQTRRLRGIRRAREARAAMWRDLVVVASAAALRILIAALAA
jgi:hypothetical protein